MALPEDIYRDRLYWEKIKKEREEAKRRPQEIEETMRWIYIHFRVGFSELEQTIEARGEELSEEEAKRLDKAMVVMKTGFKMMKKVIRSRAPTADTSAWRAPATIAN